MKKLIRNVALLFAMVFAASTVSAQDMPIPVDSEVRIGTLPNGLTYYIRHNEKPAGQADFYIAQKVGSVLEEDNQRGLAHFLEHMCFNGTTHFPGNGIIEWLETVGVKFGANLNAYTSIDETVYNISNVPVARESVQDSCLLILHDWANDLLLEDEEIDKERGVIHQEWRRSMVGQMRIIENILPTMYPGSRYGYRLPIGTMEVVDNFPYKALRDYYETWYRPDQQGIVVVGDIDVDRIEAKIKEMFSDIEMPENAPERVYFPVPDTPGTIYAIGSDAEQTIPIVSLNFKTEAIPNEMKNQVTYLIMKYVLNMATNMLDQRLSDIASRPDAPFAQAGVDYGDYFLSKTVDALDLTAVPKDGDAVGAIKAAYRELLRAAVGGFTSTEYERARDEYMSRLEKAYNNREDRQNEAYVHEYVRHFIDNEPIPSIEDEYQLMQMIVPMIPVDAINQMFPELISADNRVLMALIPEQEGIVIPTEEQFATAFAEVEAEDLEVFVDDVKTEPLIEALPAPGKITSESHNAQWDATELVLSNGVHVIVKQTDFKKDEILFGAQAMGGTSVVSDDYATDLKALPVALSQYGLGTYTNTDLEKYLKGKQVAVSYDLDEYTREISGSTTVKDLPTMMEIIYMAFTNLTLDEDEFVALQNMFAGILANQESDPGYIFGRDVAKTLYENPRKQTITADDVRAANRENILNIAKEMTANAADYLFVFVGNVDLDVLRPLLEQYVATLPTDVNNIRNTAEYNPTLEVRPGSGVDTYTTAMQTPQTYVYILANANGEPYSMKNRLLASTAGQILSKRLLDTVREDMGAVYSIGASGFASRQPGFTYTIASQFPMKPEMKQEVLDFIAAEFQRMTTNVTPAELSKVQEYMVKNFTENKRENGAWLGAIEGWSMNGVDTFNGDVEAIQAITVEDVQNFLKSVLDEGNYRVVVLEPAE